MSETETNQIVLLVERLQEENELELTEVYERLGDYPGWLQWIHLITLEGKHYGPSTVTLITGTQVGAPGLVSPRVRHILLHTLLPYALLTDERYTPIERAARLLEQTNLDVSRFCAECFQNENETIVAAAHGVRTAYEAEQGLLRGAPRPPERERELLRPPAAGAEPANSLLRAAAPAAHVEPPQTGWIQRLWNRLRGG